MMSDPGKERRASKAARAAGSLGVLILTMRRGLIRNFDAAHGAGPAVAAGE
jgi:hypothetical protein